MGLALASNPELDVTQAEAHILSHLAETGAARISDLHERFGHRRSTLTSVLDRLEKRRLIERRSDVDDRRSFVVTLTKQGRPVAATVHRTLLAIEQAALQALGAAKRAQVADALDAIAATASDPERRP